MTVLIPNRILPVYNGRVIWRARAAACSPKQTDVDSSTGVRRVRIVRLNVVEASRSVDKVEARIPHSRAQRLCQPGNIVGFTLALDVAKCFGVDQRVAVGVVVRTHVLGETVGALEAVGVGEVAGAPVHADEIWHHDVLLVGTLTRVRVGAVGERIVCVVPWVVEGSDDLEIRVRVGVGVDVLHCQLLVGGAVCQGIVEHRVIAGSRLAGEIRPRL